MKNSIYRLAAIGIAALLTFISCGDKPVTEVVTPPEPSLEVTVPANVPASGGDVTFEITSNVEWTVSEQVDAWVIGVIPRTGTGDGTVTVTLDESQDTAVRTSSFTVTGGGITRDVTVTQDALKFVDQLVGRWRSNGDYVVEFSPSKDQHYVTIEKIDDNTVRMIDVMGVATRFSNMTSEQDTFIATVDNTNRTISIAAQPIEPTFDLNGLPVYLCRFKNDYNPNWDANWKVGFDDIPVADNMKIDFSAGGWQVGHWGGAPAYASFVPLSQNPSGTNTYFYLWYFTNTVWTKED